jgi:hypothetical protein
MSELASFSDSSRQSALQRFQLLRAHLEDGRSLERLQYWLERFGNDLSTGRYVG